MYVTSYNLFKQLEVETLIGKSYIISIFRFCKWMRNLFDQNQNRRVRVYIHSSLRLVLELFSPIEVEPQPGCCNEPIWIIYKSISKPGRLKIYRHVQGGNHILSFEINWGLKTVSFHLWGWTLPRGPTEFWQLRSSHTSPPDE